MDIEQFSVFLGVTAGITQLIGYVAYVRYASGNINTGSWMIWAIGGIVDLVSYFIMTGDWVVNVLPAACAVAAVAVFVWAFVKKRLTWPDATDRAFIAGDTAISIIWFYTNVIVANILFQVSTVLSFIPIWRAQWSGKEKEDPRPWLIWTGSYLMLSGSVLLRHDQWEELIYPGVHLVTHLVVVIIAIIKLRPSR